MLKLLLIALLSAQTFAQEPERQLRSDVDSGDPFGLPSFPFLLNARPPPGLSLTKGDLKLFSGHALNLLKTKCPRLNPTTIFKLQKYFGKQLAKANPTPGDHNPEFRDVLKTITTCAREIVFPAPTRTNPDPIRDFLPRPLVPAGARNKDSAAAAPAEKASSSSEEDKPNIEIIFAEGPSKEKSFFSSPDWMTQWAQMSAERRSKIEDKEFKTTSTTPTSFFSMPGWMTQWAQLSAERKSKKEKEQERKDASASSTSFFSTPDWMAQWAQMSAERKSKKEKEADVTSTAPTSTTTTPTTTPAAETLPEENEDESESGVSPFMAWMSSIFGSVTSFFSRIFGIGGLRARRSTEERPLGPASYFQSPAFTGIIRPPMGTHPETEEKRSEGQLSFVRLFDLVCNIYCDKCRSPAIDSSLRINPREFKLAGRALLEYLFSAVPTTGIDLAAKNFLTKEFMEELEQCK